MSRAPRSRRAIVPDIYGLKRDSPQLPWSYLNERMTAAQHYWLVTNHPSGWPQARPVDGVWIDERLWFGGSPESRWCRNLDRDSRASVHLEDGMAAVMLEGRVQRIGADPALAQRVADASNEKYGYGQSADDYASGAMCFDVERALAWKMLFEDATHWTLEPRGSAV